MERTRRPTLLVLLSAASLLSARGGGGGGAGGGAGGAGSFGGAEALAFPRRPVRPGGTDRRRGGGGGGGGGRGGGGGNGDAGAGVAKRRFRRAPPPPSRRLFTTESVLPPLDVTELSAFAPSSPTSNGTDAAAADVVDGDDDARDCPSAAELFTAPYVAPSAHQDSDLGCLPHVCGPLPVVYTNDPRSVERWLSEHVYPSSSSSSSSGGGGPSLVGFDVESVPDAPWMKSRSAWDGPALVQVSTPHACLVAQLTRRRGDRRSSACPALEPLLADPSVVKAGAGIDDDALELYRFNPRMRARSRFDLGGVGSAGPGGNRGRGRRVGLKRLVRAVLGVEMRKSRRLAVSDWSRRPLDGARIAYAARDAWAGAAVAHDLAERFPDVFSPSVVAEMVAERERTVEELDERARRRRGARAQLAEIYEQFREYGEPDGRHALREQMPESIREEMERLQGIVEETAPDGLIAFDAQSIGLIL